MTPVTTLDCLSSVCSFLYYILPPTLLTSYIHILVPSTANRASATSDCQDRLAPSFWKHHDSDNEYKTWMATRDFSVRFTDDEKNFYPDDSVISDVDIHLAY